MPRFETRRRVPHTARQMFDLVADVEKYPRFLPLCEALRIKRRETVDGKPALITEMDVGYGALHERLTSRVMLDADTLQVLATYVEGPFRHMENRWSFADASDGGSDVIFFIDYEFKSMVLQMLMGGLFDTVFRKFTTAFEQRARDVYDVVGS